VDPLEAALLGALKEKCDVMRSSRTPDGYGGWTESAESAARSVPCRTECDRGATEGPLAGRLQGWAGLTVHLPGWADVRLGDELAVGGRRLRVVGLRPADDGSPLKAAMVVEEAEAR
jgi:hypothetical protein